MEGENMMQKNITTLCMYRVGHSCETCHLGATYLKYNSYIKEGTGRGVIRECEEEDKIAFHFYPIIYRARKEMK